MAKENPMAIPGGGGGARSVAGISGKGGKNVNPINKPSTAKLIKNNDHPDLKGYTGLGDGNDWSSGFGKPFYNPKGK